MRYLISILFLLFSLVCFSDGISYKNYYSIVDREISLVKSEINNIKSQIKVDKNNVELHKQLVRKQTELEILNDKKTKIKNAEKKYNELVKQNAVLDKEKTKLLHIKQQSEEMDKEVIRIFEKNGED